MNEKVNEMKKLLLAVAIILGGCAQGPQVRPMTSPPGVAEALMQLGSPPPVWVPQVQPPPSPFHSYQPPPSPFHSYQFGTNLPIYCTTLGGMTTCN